MVKLILAIVLMTIMIVCVYSSSKDKPHGHKGVLQSYTGKPLPMNLTPAQKSKLDKGESVLYNERDGSSGRGVVIQDVNASAPVCMSKIRDLKSYSKMVPHVKAVDIYYSEKFLNGTSKSGAKFDIGLLGMRFGYFLLLTHEPKYNTLTWTLDYKYNSDFDDNVGHWQLMPHPSKKGWTRILYSTKIKLFNWIPEFVIKFLTSKALSESTTWVKRESELEQAKVNKNKPSSTSGLAIPSWLNLNGGSAILKEKLKNNINNLEEDIRTQQKRFASYIPKSFSTKTFVK